MAGFVGIRTFETLRRQAGDRQAAKVTVELLALAHERGCEAELAQALDDALEAGQLPDLAVLRARFGPGPEAVPVVEVRLAALASYDELIPQGADWPLAISLANMPANLEVAA